MAVLHRLRRERAAVPTIAAGQLGVSPFEDGPIEAGEVVVTQTRPQV